MILKNLNSEFFLYLFIESIKDQKGMDEDPEPVLFSTDPDPTCNNGYIKLFSS